MSYRPKIKNDATGTVSDLALDAETLAGHDSSYYLNYNNLTNKPTIPVNDIIILEDNGSTTAGTWLAKTSKISAYADGQIFLYKLVVAGASTTTLNITGSGGSALGAKTVYRVGTTKLGTQYPVGHYILLVYNSLNTCFRVLNDYDENTYAYVRQYQHGSNAAGTTNLYPILTRYNLTNKNGTYDTAYTRYYTDTYINTTNGYLYAPKVYSGGTEVLTSHQDISGKADKTATVSTITWNTNKLTKTINGTTTDVVTVATLKTALGLGSAAYTDSTAYASSTHDHSSLKNNNGFVAYLPTITSNDFIALRDTDNKFSSQQTFKGDIIIKKNDTTTTRYIYLEYIQPQDSSKYTTWRIHGQNDSLICMYSSPNDQGWESIFTISKTNVNFFQKTINNYSLKDACAKNVDTSISAASTSTNLPTSAAVASFVEGKGYITLQTANDLLKNPLYNIGPYDTISGNTITRQTGYAQIKDLEWSKISNNRFEAVISDAEGSSDATTSDIIFSGIFSASSPNNVYYNSSSNIAAINSSKYLLIFVTSDYYSNKTVNDFLSDYGNVYIQYKLATSYTEKAITNKQLNVNSELEKDVAKNMYNLGKYDSQPVINSDNTVTITRNTGFIVADWHWTKDSDGYNNLKRYYHYFDSLLDAEYGSNGVGVFYSNYGVSDYSTKAGAYFGKANNKTFVGFLTTDDLSDSQLNALGITIQYKLATSYTEKAIYNSPVKPSSISGYKLITTAEYDSLVNQANAGLEYQDIYNSYTEVNSGTYKTLITLELDENCVYLVVGHAETNFHDASEPCGVWLRVYNSDHTLIDERVNRTMNHSGGGVDATMIINTKTGSARWVSCLVYNYYPGIREFSARMTVVKLVTNK